MLSLLMLGGLRIVLSYSVGPTLRTELYGKDPTDVGAFNDRARCDSLARRRRGLVAESHVLKTTGLQALFGTLAQVSQQDQVVSFDASSAAELLLELVRPTMTGFG